jgi:hypothetical protein
LLGLHHDQFDEPLGHLAGVGGLLDFWHGVLSQLAAGLGSLSGGGMTAASTLESV